MAAYAVLISLDQTLEDFIQKNRNQILDHHENGRHLFQYLHQNIISLLRIFDDFPQKVSKWEEQIHDAANEAESIIEDYISLLIWDAEMSPEEEQSLFHNIGKVSVTFESILDEMKMGVYEGQGIGEEVPYVVTIQREEKEKLFGVDNHLTEIRNRIFSDSYVNRQIVPIVGMGGIGKTSLAKAIFDDKDIINQFDLCRWVTVSQNYNVKAILLAILGVENLLEEVNVSIIDLGVRVNQLLYHRRYLLVLDDIWDLDAWDEVQTRLRDDGNRSWVFFTTRREDVARYAKSLGFICELKLLDKETSWSMLEYRVFGEEPCPLELEEIGYDIAKGCDGLPLAIVVIAGILINTSLNQDSWLSIANNIFEALELSNNSYMKILALSYQHLPHYLRPCFLYMSVFSKDEAIRVSILLKFWIADGFIKPRNSSMDMEEIAYQYLKQLLKRNLIIFRGKSYNGRIKLIHIHGLLGDLCKKKAEEEKFLHFRDTMVEGITTTRRATFLGTELPYLRTLICTNSNNDFVSESKFLSCKHLRIFDAYPIVNNDFPSHLLKLCHLRYLELNFQPVEGFEIPLDICKLENLEILSINLRGTAAWMFKSFTIPVEIWKMSKLKKIEFFPPSYLASPKDESLYQLPNLLSLQKVRNFCFTEETVKRIPNVRKLDLFYDIVPTEESCSEYYFSNVGNLNCLEIIKLQCWSGEYYDLGWSMWSPLLKSMTFSSSLKKLKFGGGAVRAAWEDMARIIGPLPNLQVLKVRDNVFFGSVWEMKEGDFENLRVLEIHVSDLECWVSEGENPLPSLQRLALTACPNLTELPDDIGNIATLESIIVDDHQEAIVDWAKQIEEEQLDCGNQLLRVIILYIAATLDKCEDEESKEVWISDYLHNYGMGIFKKVIDSVAYYDKDLSMRAAERAWLL